MRVRQDELDTKPAKAPTYHTRTVLEMLHDEHQLEMDRIFNRKGALYGERLA